MNYSFHSKSVVLAALQNSEDFRIKAMVVLHSLHTEGGWFGRDKVGFMSSHARHGMRIADKVLFNEPLTTEDLALVAKIAPRYSRQIAMYLRSVDVIQDPRAKEIAKVFGVAHVQYRARIQSALSNIAAIQEREAQEA